MELKEGMYIRTSKGKIRKFESNNSMARVPFMIKCSYNIIDLVQIGDYVNGCKVIRQYAPEGNYCLWIKLDDGTYIDKDEDIKTIVTREQFESIKYEVK